MTPISDAISRRRRQVSELEEPRPRRARPRIEEGEEQVLERMEQRAEEEKRRGEIRLRQESIDVRLRRAKRETRERRKQTAVEDAALREVSEEERVAQERMVARAQEDEKKAVLEQEAITKEARQAFREQEAATRGARRVAGQQERLIPPKKQEKPIKLRITPASVLVEGLKPLVAKIPEVSKIIIRALTPWEESKETFGEFVLATPQRLITGRPEKSQDTLKAIFEAERAAPLWSRILFGQTVTKAPDGKYLEFVMLDFPVPIGPAKAPPRAVVKTIEINFMRFLKAKKPAVSTEKWAQVIKAIEAGAIKNADDVARFVGKPGIPPVTPKVPRVGGRPPAPPPFGRAPAPPPKRVAIPGKPPVDIPATTRTPEQLFRDAVEAAVKQRATTSIESSKVIIAPLTTARLDVVLADTKTPEAAIKTLKDAGILPLVVAAQPEKAIELITRLSPSERRRLFVDLKAQTDLAVDAANLTVEQQKIVTTQQTEVVRVVIIDVGFKAGEEAANEGATNTEIKTAVQNAVENVTKTVTDTKVKTKLQEKTKPLVKTITDTVIKQKTKPTEKPARVEAKAKPKVSKPVGKAPVRESFRSAKPFPIKLPKDKRTDAKKRKVVKSRRGAITWRMGELNKKDVWHVWMIPYRSKADHLVVLGKAPAGAIVVKGPKSAFRTATTVFGRAPTDGFLATIGFIEAKVMPTNGKVELVFTPRKRVTEAKELPVPR